MNIASCKIEKNNIKLARKFSYSLATLDYLPYMLVTIQTDNDILGYGEAATGWDTTGEMQEGSKEVFDLVKPLLIGKKVDSVEDVEVILKEISKFIYGNTALKSGIEFALLDALGKFENKPIYKLIGGKKIEFVIK